MTKWHSNNKKITPQKLAEIVVMVKKRIPVSVIATKLGEKEKHIRNAIFDHTDGVRALQARVRGEPIPTGRVPTELINEITKLVLDGLSGDQIAPLVGKSPSMVKSILYNYTIGIRRLRAEAKKEKAA